MTHSTPSSPKPKSKHTPEPTAKVTFDFEAIGTAWQVELFDEVPQALAVELKRAILDRIEQFDRNYSRFRSDSLVTAMSKTTGIYSLPLDAEALFDIYQQLYELTDGLFTPMIGRTLSSAGYDADYSLQPGILSQPPGWQEALDYEFPHLTVKQPVLLDVGAAGKGYLVDIVSQLLRDKDIRNFCVNAGGDISYQSASDQALSIALEHPGDPSQAIGIANIHNQSLCGSAGNRRSWADFHHIMHPETLRSPRHIEALWVTAKDTITADALSTALFFVEPFRLKAAFDFEYAIIQADYSLRRSAGFPAEFFIQ
jgi:thiamine biosynthesis lipoprotein